MPEVDNLTNLHFVIANILLTDNLEISVAV